MLLFAKSERAPWYSRLARHLGFGYNSPRVEEKTTAAAIEASYRSGLALEQAVARQEYLTGSSQPKIIATLHSFCRHYDEHDTPPLPFFDVRLLNGFDHARFSRTLAQAQLSSLEAAAHMTRVYGMQVSAQDASLPGLEQRIEKAAAHYNAGRSREERFGLGESENASRQLLQEHVNRSYACSSRGKKNVLLLNRFDRRLLPDFENYALEATRLYESDSATLRDSAQKLTHFFGMHISASTLSRIARAQLAKQGKVLRRRPNRKERNRQNTQHTEPSAPNPS